MQNPLANLFLSLQATITALQDGDGNKYFRFIDQDLGQLEYHNGNERPPVSWPCVLIDISDMATASLGQNVQEGTLTVTLRMAFPPFSSSSNITPPEYRNKALYYYDLEQVLYLALQGTVPSYLNDDEEDILADVFGPLTRIRSTTEAREDFIRVRIITYQINLNDYSAKHTITYTPAAIDLTTQIELETP